MHVTFLTRISALIYRRGLRQRVASLTLDCNGVFAIRAYSTAIANNNFVAHNNWISLAKMSSSTNSSCVIPEMSSTKFHQLLRHVEMGYSWKADWSTKYGIHPVSYSVDTQVHFIKSQITVPCVSDRFSYYNMQSKSLWNESSMKYFTGFQASGGNLFAIGLQQLWPLSAYYKSSTFHNISTVASNFFLMFQHTFNW